MTAPGDARRHLRDIARLILREALRVAQPGPLVSGHLHVIRGGWLRCAGRRRRIRHGRLVLLAVGKAAPAMAAAALRRLGRAVSEGLVVTADGVATAGLRDRRLRVLRSGHPLPDERGLYAGKVVEELLRPLGRDDTVLVLLSGGASALLPAPVATVTLADKAATTRTLMAAGSSITELNIVRRHLSRLKGGGLARLAHPAAVRALVLSDVVGDDPATIASGPCSPDPSTYAHALAVLRSRRLLSRIPPSVRRHLEAGARGEREETATPGDECFRHVALEVIGGNRKSVFAAAGLARRLGFRTRILTTELGGEARHVAPSLVKVLRRCAERGQPVRLPACLLAGGETTVTVSGRGEGGRNQELAVAGARALAGFPQPALIAALGTDGIDGRSDAAGGIADDSSVDRATRLGLASPEAFLCANDSRNWLGPLGDLIVTGPTGTNVADIVVLLAARPRYGRRV